jgi:hypothetical protein
VFLLFFHQNLSAMTSFRKYILSYFLGRIISYVFVDSATWEGGGERRGKLFNVAYGRHQRMVLFSFLLFLHSNHRPISG